MKTCVLIRHALTQGNTDRIYMGCRTDQDILPVDVKRIRTIAGLIAKVSVDPFVVSGPLKRCQSTARALFPGSDIVTVDPLTEIDFGAFEGRSINSLKDDPRYIAWVDSGGRMIFPEGEGRDEFIQRSMKGFKEAVSLSADSGCVVIICCGGNIMSIMSALTGEDYFDFMTDNLDGYNLSFDYDDERISVISYDRIDCGCDT